MTSPGLQEELARLLAQLEQFAADLAMAERLAESGLVLAARQTIRMLWTRLQPPAPAEEKPGLQSVPPSPEDPPGDVHQTG